MNRNNSKKQEGFVLVVVAIVLLALVGFLALAVDVGVLYSARTSAQEVADAAALAGAGTFINDTQSPQPQTASDNALQVAINNSILGQPVAAGDVNVNVDLGNRRVTVDVQSTQNTYFARALGVQTANVAAQAVAEASQYAAGSTCAKPWFIPNTVFAPSDPNNPCIGCSTGQVLISGGEITPFGRSQIGQEFTVTSRNPKDSLAPGQFYAIRLPGSSGASDYRHNIENCAKVYIRCGDFYSTENGDMGANTENAVNALIGNPPTDTWRSVGEYQTPNGLSDTSKAVVVAPIWDSCGASGFCTTGNFPTGQTNLQIIGFAAFFLERVQGGQVVSRLISVSSCGASGTPGVGNSGGTVLSLPLRLVRTQ